MRIILNFFFVFITISGFSQGITNTESSKDQDLMFGIEINIK